MLHSPLAVVRQNLQVIKKLRLGLGYGLSMRSQKEWEQIEREERKRAMALKQVQRLIEWSHQEYEAALNKHRSNIKLYAELTLNWCPERVLSKHKDFAALCVTFRSDAMWRMLSRKERKFIADAVAYKSQ
jgi:hypothetical protein